MSLPARGRSIEGHICKRILTENLPLIIEKVRKTSEGVFDIMVLIMPFKLMYLDF